MSIFKWFVIFTGVFALLFMGKVVFLALTMGLVPLGQTAAGAAILTSGYFVVERIRRYQRRVREATAIFHATYNEQH